VLVEGAVLVLKGSHHCCRRYTVHWGASMCIVREQRQIRGSKEESVQEFVNLRPTRPSGEGAGVFRSAEHLYNPAKVQECIAKFYPGLCVGSWCCALWRPLALQLFAYTWVAAMALRLPKAGAYTAAHLVGKSLRRGSGVTEQYLAVAASLTSINRQTAGHPMSLPPTGTEGGTFCKMTS
jgi:hypothetical protein